MVRDVYLAIIYRKSFRRLCYGVIFMNLLTAARLLITLGCLPIEAPQDYVIKYDVLVVKDTKSCIKAIKDFKQAVEEESHDSTRITPTKPGCGSFGCSDSKTAQPINKEGAK